MSVVSKWPIKTVATLIAALCALTGCTSYRHLPFAEPARLAGAAKTEHRLVPGEQVAIVVFGEKDLSGTFVIDPTGRIAMPLLGPVRAAGLTSRQLRAHLTNRLSKGYLQKPRVTVDVAAYLPLFIHGEVKKPGEFPYRPGLTITDAIALAGGYTYRADETFVVLRRRTLHEPVKVTVPAAAALRPGDNVRVPERFF